MKKTVSRIPASFTAVIAKCVVNEAGECLDPFFSTDCSQIILPSYFPDSHSLSPSCNTFDQAFHLFPTTSHLQQQHLPSGWYHHLKNNKDRLSRVHTDWAAAGRTYGMCSFHTQGSLLCQVATRFWDNQYMKSKTHWLQPILVAVTFLIAPTLWAWFVALPLSSWSKISKFSLAGHNF